MCYIYVVCHMLERLIYYYIRSSLVVRIKSRSCKYITRKVSAVVYLYERLFF